MKMTAVNEQEQPDGHMAWVGSMRGHAFMTDISLSVRLYYVYVFK